MASLALAGQLIEDLESLLAAAADRALVAVGQAGRIIAIAKPTHQVEGFQLLRRNHAAQTLINNPKIHPRGIDCTVNQLLFVKHAQIAYVVPMAYRLVLRPLDRSPILIRTGPAGGQARFRRRDRGQQQQAG